ncbi:DeoR family transcriptional regulator [Curtobacterium flaccumfaciens]|nr:DeoR family transcriptional regulator [Curtobacterium flaccumfaciens]
MDVKDLAELLAVTPETIRRDLTSLERRGLVRRARRGDPGRAHHPPPRRR